MEYKMISNDGEWLIYIYIQTRFIHEHAAVYINWHYILIWGHLFNGWHFIHGVWKKKQSFFNGNNNQKMPRWKQHSYMFAWPSEKWYAIQRAEKMVHAVQMNTVHSFETAAEAEASS